MEPKLIPFKAEHLLSMINRDGNQFTSVKALIEKEEGVAWTAVVDGKMIGCAGIMIHWEGVGFAWAVFTKAAPRHLYWGTKMVKNVLRDTIRSYNLHRVELLALEESSVNQRWARFLGFTREKNGVAQSMTSDKRNMIRYEWING